MRRKTRSLLTAVLTFSLLTACGAEKESPFPVTEEYAESLARSDAFDIPLEPVDFDLAVERYSLKTDDCKRGICYAGESGSEEFFLLECTSEEGAGRAADALRAWTEDRREELIDYAPAAADKAGNAYTTVRGNTAMMAIAADYDALAQFLSE